MSEKAKGSFSVSPDVFEKLLCSSRIVVKDVLDIKACETVLIITNPDRDVNVISRSLFEAALEVGAKPTMLIQPVKTQLDFAEPATIMALKSAPDVIVSTSKEKLGKDSDGLKNPYEEDGKKFEHIFNFLQDTKRSRAFWSPGVTVDMYIKTIPIDYGKLRQTCSVLSEKLTRAVEARLTSAAGCDLVIGLSSREAFNDDGDFRAPGKGGNLPCGETYISPALGTSSGMLVFEGSIGSHKGEILIDTPIRCEVEGGFVVDVSGGKEADLLRESLEKGAKTAREFAAEGKIPAEEEEEYAKNAYSIGELGVGLNEKARIIGNMLEDEKVASTCHIAIGSNYDEDAKALIHLDGLIKSPTLTVKYEDGSTEVVMEEGTLTL